MEAFQMKRTDENLFKAHHSMLNLKQLKLYTDSNRVQMDSISRGVFTETKNYISYMAPYYHDSTTRPVKTKPFKDFLHDYVPKDQQRNAISNALGQVQQLNSIFQMKEPEYKAYTDKEIRYNIEFHRKFTLAVSCLLLFAIGAPLGAIIRKGGLGLPVVVAIIFFLIYHIISTMAEKAAKDGSLDPILGMWMAVIVLSPLAAFLTYKSTTDSSLFDIEQYKLKLEAFWKTINGKFNKKLPS